MKMIRRIAWWILVAAIPVALILEFTHGDKILLFIASAMAVLPVAAWIGHATEHLAVRMGSTLGALFNATFGNLAEMIIAVLAIRAGLPEVVKASLTGSIVGNLLFVGGLAMLLGGWKRENQRFTVLAAESQAGQLVLAVAAFLIPALFLRTAAQAHHPELIHQVSLGTSGILIATYAAGLFFSFKTHKHLMSLPREGEEGAPDHGTTWPVKKAVLVLLGASSLMGLVAEGLVHAVEEVGKQWGMNEVFLGFVVVAIVGNAAEHSTAVVLAMKNQMDTALNIAMQSSVQIAIFVTPLLVFLSYPLGHPLDLIFTPFEMLAVVLTIGIFAYLVINGETNWYEGVQLLALYAIIAVAMYFLPMSGAPAAALPAH